MKKVIKTVRPPRIFLKYGNHRVWQLPSLWEPFAAGTTRQEVYPGSLPRKFTQEVYPGSLSRKFIQEVYPGSLPRKFIPEDASFALR